MTALEIVLLVFCIAFFAMALIACLIALSELRKVRYARIAGESRAQKKTLSVRAEQAHLFIAEGAATLIDAPDGSKTAANAVHSAEPAEPPVADIAENSVSGPEPEPVAESASAKAVQAAEEFAVAAAAEENASAVEEDTVVIPVRGEEKKTFQQKYDALDPIVRARFDRVLAYLMEKPDCRKTQSNTSLTVKCKTDKVMRVLIRRGSVLLHFMLANNELNRFVREEGVKAIKISPVVVRLDNEEDEDLAKQTADITLDEIVAEQKYRKERLKEIRRERRRRKEAERAAAEAENRGEQGE